MSHTIAAYVNTAHGTKYVAQLCQHWSHKMAVTMEGTTGTVPFPHAIAVMVPDETGVAVSITGADRDEVERLTDVVARHIDRFAFREGPLHYDWQWQQQDA